MGYEVSIVYIVFMKFKCYKKDDFDDILLQLVEVCMQLLSQGNNFDRVSFVSTVHTQVDTKAGKELVC